MQPKFKEEWSVRVGKECFVLNEKEMPVLREAMKRGERWVSFERVILSVPHIECIYLSKKQIADQIENGSEDYTEHDRTIAKEKLLELKEERFGVGG